MARHEYMWGSEGIASCMLNHGAGWRQMNRFFMPWLL